MIFIAGILILAGVLWLGFQITGKRSHNTIRITVDGKEFGTYSLSQDQVIHIGDTNVCEIKNGKVTMIEATCPDHYCMKQKAVDEHGGSIICLPNMKMLWNICVMCVRHAALLRQMTFGPGHICNK